MRTSRYICPEHVPAEWYEKAFSHIVKLSQLLKNVDSIDGRLVDIDDYSTVVNECMEQRMHNFKSLARSLLGSPLMQKAVKENMATLASGKCTLPDSFGKPNEREPMTVNSLTVVCNFLNISAQQRKEVRFTVCPQVTQHRIWMGALEETLNGLKSEMETLDHRCYSPSKGRMMGQQIVQSCLNFLADKAVISCDPDSTSWMRPKPARVPESPSRKWEEVLEMFNHLLKCLRANEEGLHLYVSKLEAMKEGLSQIKDVLVDGKIGYKEARHQQSLVQKKLRKTLGHSSRCLFTLLVYYLYGSIGDIEVDVCGGLYGSDGGDRCCLYMGRILTSDDEKMVQSGVKQLDRALGLFKFIWETAKMKGVLELQGHLWCVEAEERLIMYRGNVFFVHKISI